MVELKRKNFVAINVKSNNNTLEYSSNVTVDSEFDGEDGWIIIKKQRVNILIPHLPSDELSAEPLPEQGQLHGTSICTINTLELPQKQPHEAQVAEIDDGLIHCSPVLNVQSSPNVLLPVDNVEDQVCALTSFPRKTYCPSKFSASSKHIRPSIQSGMSGVCNFSTSSMNVGNKIRALNLERNISSAGGLGRWLSSLGLDQFERIFRANNVSKFHLVNLTMKKLKDMGAHAVGPRRKLIHAIESVSQPYSLFKPCKN